MAEGLGPEIEDINLDPDNPELESKTIAYEDMADVLGRSLDQLTVLPEDTAVDIFDRESLQDLLRDMIHQTLLIDDNQGAVLRAAVSHELRDDGDGLDPEGEYGRRQIAAFTSVMGDLGSEDANVIQTILAIGANTAARVMPAYWRMIKEAVGDEGFYELAKSEKTMKTLSVITRAWHRSEVNTGLSRLGINHETPNTQTMLAELFDIDDDGVSIKAEQLHLFRTSVPELIGRCPMGHMVDIKNEHGEVESVMPIKEMASIVLDAWQAQQTAV